jgi:hypothetical protein
MIQIQDIYEIHITNKGKPQNTKPGGVFGFWDSDPGSAYGPGAREAGGEFWS